MTLEELKEKLVEITNRYGDDPEVCHYKADQLLIKYIGDEEVSTLFDDIPKWYA